MNYDKTALLMMILAPVAAMLVRMAISRTPEPCRPVGMRR